MNAEKMAGFLAAIEAPPKSELAFFGTKNAWIHLIERNEFYACYMPRHKPLFHMIQRVATDSTNLTGIAEVRLSQRLAYDHFMVWPAICTDETFAHVALAIIRTSVEATPELENAQFFLKERRVSNKAFGNSGEPIFAFVRWITHKNPNIQAFEGILYQQGRLLARGVIEGVGIDPAQGIVKVKRPSPETNCRLPNHSM